MKSTECKKSFAAAVKLRRGSLHLSQETLAERAGLHRTYISDIERGARNLSLENISKLALALDMSIAELFAPPTLSRLGLPAAPLPLPAGSGEILLVEDNPDDVELTLRAFAKARFKNEVRVVRDGKEALDYVFCRGHYAYRATLKLPHLILLDLKLPKVSGLEVLRQLKAEKRTQTIPVVVLTMSESRQDIAECRRLGAGNYIVKPVDFQNLSQATPQLNLDWVLLDASATSHPASAANAFE